MSLLHLAGISTDDKTYWAYAVGDSVASAVCEAVERYPTAFLLPLAGYNPVDVASVEKPYGRALRAACKQGCVYVPQDRLVGGIQHLSGAGVRRMIEDWP